MKRSPCNHTTLGQEAFGDLVRAALEPVAAEASATLRKARRGDPEAIHDARVALRRLRQGLVVADGAGCGPPRARKLARRLRRIERALGPTRDDDVLVADLSRWLQPPQAGAGGASTRRPQADRPSRGLQAKADAGPAAFPLCEKLAKQRQKHAQRLEIELGRGRTRRTMKGLRRWVCGSRRADRGAKVDRGAKNAGGGGLVRRFVVDQVRRTYGEILARRTPVDVCAVHEARSSCRRLRFTLDLFHDMLNAPDRAIAPLRGAQRRLGDLHDDAMAAARISRWIANGKVPDSRIIRAYLARRAASQRHLRARFEHERLALAGRRFRLALFRAFDPASPSARS